MGDTVEFSFPTRVVFGPGSVAGVAALCAELGVTRPLIVTDPGLVAAGLHERVLAPLDAAGLASQVFHDIQGNPV